VSIFILANHIRLYSAIHVGSHWKIQDRKPIKITDNKKLSTTQKKQTTQNTPKPVQQNSFHQPVKS